MAYHSGVVIAEYAQALTPEQELAALTDGQRGVLVLLARGLVPAQVDTALSLERGTAAAAIDTLVGTVGAQEPTELVVLAYRGGLVRPGSAEVPEVLGRKLAGLSDREFTAKPGGARVRCAYTVHELC